MDSAGGGLDGSDEAGGMTGATEGGRNEEIDEPWREVRAGSEAACGKARRAGCNSGGEQDEAMLRVRGTGQAVAEPGRDGRQKIGPFSEGNEGERCVLHVRVRMSEAMKTPRA